MIAIITNKRAQANQNGSHVCTVTCPGCGYSRPVSFGGWSAIVCGGCKATLYRNSASKRSDRLEAMTPEPEPRALVGMCGKLQRPMTPYPEPEPEPHPTSYATNMVLALEYQKRTGRLPSWVQHD